jgi:putative ABC transport system substrate-binding protein
MQRREFITLLGGAAAAWPLTAGAQRVDRVRRIGVLNGTAPTGQNPAAYAAFLRRLGELGWTDGRNVRIEVRWANSDLELMRSYGTELAGHSPDVFLVQSNPALAALRPLAGNTPIVFVHVADPVGSGFVASLARPGGNITGFTNFEPSMGSKWLQTLKQVAPDVAHAAVLFHPQTPANVAFWREAEAAAPKVGISVVAAGVSTTLARSSALSPLSRRNPTAALSYAPIPSPRSIFVSLSSSRASIAYRRYIRSAITPKRVDCCRMESMLWIWCRVLPIMSIALCAAPIPASYRCRRRPNSSW